MKIEINHGRVIDPKHGIDRVTSLYIAAGTVVAIGEAPAGWSANRVLDARGMIVCPGLIDLSARLREPGFEYKATLESEMDAAVAGGVTSLACPPDTDPPLDEPGLVEMLKHRARSLNQAHVFPVGALTVGLKGDELTEMGELAEAGCVAFSQAESAAVRHGSAAARDAVRGDVRPPRVAARRRTRTSPGAVSRTTARSPRAWACRRFRRRPRRSRSRRSSRWCATPACMSTSAGSRPPRAWRWCGQPSTTGCP